VAELLAGGGDFLKQERFGESGNDLSASARSQQQNYWRSISR